MTLDHRDVLWPHADIAWEIQHDVHRGGNGGFCCIVHRASSIESFKVMAVIAVVAAVEFMSGICFILRRATQKYGGFVLVGNEIRKSALESYVQITSLPAPNSCL